MDTELYDLTLSEEAMEWVMESENGEEGEGEREGEEGSDSDFFSPTNLVLTRPGKRKFGDSYHPQGARQSSQIVIEDDGEILETCKLCNLTLNNSGSHQISSIACGHIFGRSCLENLLQTKGTAVRHILQVNCPNCNAPFRKKDIHPLWSKNLRSLDPTELKEISEFTIKNNLELESLTKELARLKELHSTSEVELDTIRKELVEVKRKVSALEDPAVDELDTIDPELMGFSANSARNAEISSRSFFEFETSIEIGSTNNSLQVFAYYPEDQTVLVSKKIDTCSYGLVTFNLKNTYFQRVYPAHSGLIRDVALFETNGEVQALSVGMDRTLVLSNPRTLTVLAKYPLPGPGWSCCFNPTKPHLVYVGLTGGQMVEFDTSVSNCNSPSRVFKFPDVTMHSPIHSLFYLRRYHVLLGANFNGVYIWYLGTKENDNSDCYNLLNSIFSELQCYSLTYDELDNNFAVSFRNPKTKSTHHQIYSFHSVFNVPSTNQVNNKLKPEIKYLVDSPFSETQLPRTVLFSPPATPSRSNARPQHLFFCLREEKRQETLIWDLPLSTSRPYHLSLTPQLQLGCPIAYHFCHPIASTNPRSYLLVLTECQVLIFRCRV